MADNTCIAALLSVQMWVQDDICMLWVRRMSHSFAMARISAWKIVGPDPSPKESSVTNIDPL